MKNKIYYVLKYFFNIIFSKLSVKIRLLNNNEESILELLETSLLSSDYSIKDRYSFLSFNMIKTFERKKKINVFKYSKFKISFS